MWGGGGEEGGGPWSYITVGWSFSARVVPAHENSSPSSLVTYHHTISSWSHCKLSVTRLIA